MSHSPTSTADDKKIATVDIDIMLDIMDTNTRGLKYIKLIEHMYNIIGSKVIRLIDMKRLDNDKDVSNYMDIKANNYIDSEMECPLLRAYLIMEYCKYYNKCNNYETDGQYIVEMATDA